jgi:hypothetical protein
LYYARKTLYFKENTTMGKITDLFTKAKAEEQKIKQDAILRFQKARQEQQKAYSFIEKHPTLIAYAVVALIALTLISVLKACA